MEVECVELVRQIWAAVASAGQVRSWRVAVEARGLKWSYIHRRGRGVGVVLRGISS